MWGRICILQNPRKGAGARKHRRRIHKGEEVDGVLRDDAGDDGDERVADGGERERAREQVAREGALRAIAHTCTHVNHVE